ncbi:hypothetical protein HPG69_010637 [Diceros bicornis minor]|uniref:Protein FAM78B n=1 Tax=Diceros bicornis minor TaxID=77932 RepID=A0A7J7EWZ8_DICBM|nr:hypothetical protein HPG69_010637 [Diceros bicornis minor]
MKREGGSPFSQHLSDSSHYSFKSRPNKDAESMKVAIIDVFIISAIGESISCELWRSIELFVESPSELLILPKLTVSSWELPDLREGRVKAISDSDGVSYPWYGNTTETVTLVGPTNKISRFSVSMNDNFYPSVTWAVPVSDSNVPLLTRIKRDQSFTTWLVAMNTTTKEKIILQTIKWRMRVDIEVDPLQLLGQRARLVGRTQQEQPRILSRMEPIPPNALVKPNANDAQVLMWRPKRGPPLVVIPPK